MLTSAQIDNIREEVRYLRINSQNLKRALLYQQDKNRKLEKENQRLKQEISRIEKERQKIREELEKVKKQRDTYRNMVFKANKKNLQEESFVFSFESHEKRKLGGQKGHKGYGRKLPYSIDKRLHVFASFCPTCKGKLNRSKTTLVHTVEDIPTPQTQQTIVTQYAVEKQWCRNCKKEVAVTPVGVIPNSRLGLNLIMQVLIWKYVCRIPLNIIVSLLELTYGLRLSQGTLVLFLKKASAYFGKPYEEILASIRAAPVKHADETGWRVNGVNNWCWAFVSRDAVYYTIEETRGKGIPEKTLAHCHKEDVLVRDDYAGYKNLAFTHQSCWAHLLRESHKEAIVPTASLEMRKLHEEIKSLYEKAAKAITIPFVKQERKQIYELLLQRITVIIETHYQAEDVKRIQYRVKSQGKNLLTALLHEDVPLTNNLAERVIRPLVVTRKISGGSRNKAGAKTHAINMSIIQTMKMRKQLKTSVLQNYILQALSKN